MILDPAVGERMLPLVRVTEHFTGVAVELASTTEFGPVDLRRRVRFRALTDGSRGLPAALQSRRKKRDAARKGLSPT